MNFHGYFEYINNGKANKTTFSRKKRTHKTWLKINKVLQKRQNKNCLVLTASEATNYDPAVSKFLTSVNNRLADLYNKEVLASWENEISGPNNLIALLESEIATTEIMSYLKTISPMVTKLKRFPILNENLRRQLSQVPELGYEALSPSDLKSMYEVTANMSEIYRKAKLCDFKERTKCNLNFIPDVQNILNTSRNVEEIEYYWLEWRRVMGLGARSAFEKFVQLYRKAAALNGFSKPSDFWFKDLEENSSEAMLLITQLFAVQPIFQQFHAHVRNALRKLYGPVLIPLNKPYPQHLAEIFIGNAYRSSKSEEVSLQLPFPELGLPNITRGLLTRGLTNPQRIFWNVAEYYRSMGFPQIEDTFWLNNARPKAEPSDADDMYCRHKAWKYYGGLKRVNFSYCPDTDEERFQNMFEAVSDVYYYRAYQREQPTLFQEEPFPNFSDALGKVFSLAATSPRYLEKMHLVDEGFTTKKARFNRLYLQGLRTIFLIPVFYVLDRYRVDILDGKTEILDNCAYWELTELYTGAQPPISRTNADFDAPAKLLMEVDDQYISQIMSILLQFQLYKSFCLRTGQYKPGDPQWPLDLCDLSNQKSIGPLVLQAMSLGSSKPYTEVLRILTNETYLSTDGLLEYFLPLHLWLLEKNSAEGVEVGWEESGKCTP